VGKWFTFVELDLGAREGRWGIDLKLDGGKWTYILENWAGKVPARVGAWLSRGQTGY